MRAILGALLLALGAAVPATAQLPTPTRLFQLDAIVPMTNAARGTTRVDRRIDPGTAAVTIFAHNLRKDAVVVDLVFHYRMPAGLGAFDELIDHLEIATENDSGDPFFLTAIDARLIPLNSNRVPLLYRVTLYRPTDAPSYRVRVRVLGNYE